ADFVERVAKHVPRSRKSIMNVEVHQMPDKGQPDQPETRDGERQVVQLGPQPSAWFTNAAKRVYTNQNGTGHADEAQNTEHYDPWRKPVDPVWIIGKGERGQPATVENGKENTNQANQQATPVV